MNLKVRHHASSYEAVHGPAAASRAAVDQLCQHPSQATAGTVARQIADAARDHLVLDLTAQVTREVGSPVIPGQPAVISGRTGVQAGGSARARVRVVVDAPRVNVDRLTTDLEKQARRIRLSRPPTPAEARFAADTSTADADWLDEPGPARRRPTRRADIDRATRPPSTGAGPARGGISPFG
jgi:hypothetical protein